MYTGLIDGMETDTAVSCSEFSPFLHKINSDKMEFTLLEQYQVFYIVLHNFISFSLSFSAQLNLSGCASVLYFLLVETEDHMTF